jgi:cytochrome c oxidase subunit 2
MNVKYKRPQLLLAMLACTLIDRARAATPMSYLHTFGPAADSVTRLDWGLLTISIVVTVLIGGLVLWAALRKRPPLPLDRDGRLAVGPARGGMPWIYIGVGISTIVLLACAIWTVLVLSAVAAPSGKQMMTIDVTGHQWWWEVHYTGSDPTQSLVTANEIHIPVGQPVRLKLDSADVIHSFWVPQLAGKTDMIPGQTNYAWIQADRPGDYRGQCGEYCGAQHAHMALHVIADEPNVFEAWRRKQMETSAPPQAPDAQRGMQVFTANCGVCHTVRGADTHGILGPDLTHLMSRSTIASGTLANNTGYLTGWVADPQALKPGSRMPSVGLAPQDLHAVVSYLQTLK